MPFYAFPPHLSTKHQFYRLMLMTFSLFVAIVLFSCISYSQIILRRNDQYVARVTKQCRDSITAQAEEMQRFVQTAVYDSSVIRYLTEKEPYARYLLGRETNKLFSNMRMINSNVEDIFVFSAGDNRAAFSSLAVSHADILSALSQSSMPDVLGAYPYSAANGKEIIHALMVGGNVYDMTSADAPSKRIGSIVVAFSPDVVADSFADIIHLDGLSLMMINEHGNAVYGRLNQPNERLLAQAMALSETQEVGSVSYLLQNINVLPVPSMRCTLLIQVDRLSILSDLLQFTIIISAVTAGILIALGLLFRSIRRQITRPISQLTHAIELRGSQEHPAALPLPEEGNRDIRILSQKMNQLFEREGQLNRQLLEATTQLYESELSQSRLELQFLRSQINPHFLYNTLETMRSIAVVRKMPELADIAKFLAQIFRYSIKGKEIVRLADELEIIRCYLSIQSLRFPGRFVTGFHIEESMLSVCIPRMCLQPLIENAIVHGLENKLAPCKLDIYCIQEGDNMLIRVSDNGIGIAPDKLEAINAALSDPLHNQSGGVGLLNVARRLKLAMGKQMNMQIDSTEGEGTTVSLLFPLKACTLKQSERSE